MPLLHQNLKDKGIKDIDIHLKDIIEKDNKLRNALFHVRSTVMVQKLILTIQTESQAKQESIINQRDQNCDTPLLYHCRKGHWPAAQTLTDYKQTNLKAQNRIGYTALHHLGKYDGNVSDPLVQRLMKERTLLKKVDINGQTPLHAASLAGNKTMVTLLCKKDKTLLFAVDKWDLTAKDLSQNQEIYQILQSFEDCQDKNRNAQIKKKSPSAIFNWREEIRRNTTIPHKGSLSELLMKKGVGFLPEHEEVAEIRKAVQMVIECFKVGMKEIDPELEFEWMPSGSVEEGSKVNLPDEFDITNNLLLVKYVTPKETEDIRLSQYVKLYQSGTLDQSMEEKLRDLFECKFLSVENLFRRFYSNGQILLSLESLWEVCSSLYRVEAGDITGSKTTISDLRLYWHGEEFPWLKMSVDIVPALRFSPGTTIHCIQDIPQNIMPKQKDLITKHIQTYGLCVVAKKVKIACKDDHKQLFRLSFSESEVDLMKSLTPNELEIYKLSKIVRHQVYCQRITGPDGKPLIVSEYITSYLLKNTLFDLVISDNTSTNLNPMLGTKQLYEHLKEHLDEGCVPMFFLPGHNIIEEYWTDKPGDWSDHLDFAKKFCDDIISRLKNNI